MAMLPLCCAALMAPRYVYPIKDLENGMLEIHESLPDSWLAKALGDTDVAAPPSIPGGLDVSLTMSGRDVVVQGKVQATVVQACARCLQPTTVSITAELSLLLVQSKTSGTKDKPSKDPKPEGRKVEKDSKKQNKRQAERHGEEVEEGFLFGAEDADLDTFTGNEVVLDAYLREAILLELPIFPLCSEACPGIGAVPSEIADSATAELSIDPRLAPLLELKNKN